MKDVLDHESKPPQKKIFSRIGFAFAILTPVFIALAILFQIQSWTSTKTFLTLAVLTSAIGFVVGIVSIAKKEQSTYLKIFGVILNAFWLMILITFYIS